MLIIYTTFPQHLSLISHAYLRCLPPRDTICITDTFFSLSNSIFYCFQYVLPIFLYLPFSETTLSLLISSPPIFLSLFYLCLLILPSPFSLSLILSLYLSLQRDLYLLFPFTSHYFLYIFFLSVSANFPHSFFSPVSISYFSHTVSLKYVYLLEDFIFFIFSIRFLHLIKLHHFSLTLFLT